MGMQDIVLFAESCESFNVGRVTRLLQEQHDIRIEQAALIKKAVTTLMDKYGEEDSNESSVC